LRRLVAIASLALVVPLLVGVVPAAEPGRYRVVSARKLDALSLGLQESDGEGYRLVGSAIEPPGFNKCAVVHLLLERSPDQEAPGEYLVIVENYFLGYSRGLEKLQDAGARGFRLSAEGLIERQCEAWVTLTWQIVVVLERTDPTARLEYVAERLPRPRGGWPMPGPWPALAARMAEGYGLVGFTRLDGAILSRQQGAGAVEGIRPDRFLLISARGRKKLAERLDWALAKGFRLAERAYTSSGLLLLEKVDAPVPGYEYRLLPKGEEAFSSLSELGAMGFRAHPYAWPIMEREPPVKLAYEYRVLEAETTEELAESMDRAATEGYRPVRFFTRPLRLLVERSRPAGSVSPEAPPATHSEDHSPGSASPR